MVDRNTAVYCWPGCVSRKSSPLFSHKTSLLDSCEPPYLRKKAARVHQLLFIVDLYHLSLALPGSTPIHFWVMMSHPLGSCWRSHFIADDATLPLSPKASAGEVSTPMSLVKSDLSLKEPQSPCFSGQSGTHAGAQTVVEAQSVVGAIRLWRVCQAVRHVAKESLEAGGAE